MIHHRIMFFKNQLIKITAIKSALLKHDSNDIEKPEYDDASSEYRNIIEKTTGLSKTITTTDSPIIMRRISNIQSTTSKPRLQIFYGIS